MSGSLLVVGTGLGLAGQLSAEARSAICGADRVFSLMGDRLVEAWLASLNPNTSPLEPYYANTASRPQAYEGMVECILAAVRGGEHVCVALYGHPGVFVTPSHEAIRRAREEGFDALMLPAVSAEDCLYADLGVDPGAFGCQSYEARDFFLNGRVFDPNAALILWQIAVLGDERFAEFTSRPEALQALSLVLMEAYPADHEVIVYEAATLPTQAPRVERIALKNLALASAEQASTLYVPPLGRPRPSPARLALLQSLLDA